jgi:ankyrin repeat protein
MAALYGSETMVSMLLRLGCDVKLKDRTGKTPADYARELHRSNIADTLAKSRLDIVPQDLVDYIAHAEHVF